MGETDKKSANKLKGCILKLEHVPYGFFEKELFGYFSQFGHVVRVRVPRSKSGRFKEKAYVLFDDKEVARLAAEAMDNYLLFDRRLRCKVLHKTVPGVIRSGPRLLPHVAIEASRLKQARRQCARKSEEEIKQARKAQVRALNKAMHKLQEAGYDYEFDFSHKIPPV